MYKKFLGIFSEFYTCTYWRKVYHFSKACVSHYSRTAQISSTSRLFLVNAVEEDVHYIIKTSHFYDMLYPDIKCQYYITVLWLCPACVRSRKIVFFGKLSYAFRL